MRIWKWKLKITDHQIINVPADAEFLDVQMQGDDCCIWYACDESAPLRPRSIAIYGAGNPIPEEAGKYIATFQMEGGALVFHAFEFGTHW